MISSKSVLENTLRVVAPAKVNLHLEVLGIRADGFHELAMLMQTIDLIDQIEIRNREDGEINFRTDNQNLSTKEDNLIVKAAKILIKKTGGCVPGADIFLRKSIPIGAGLAGGSSDGAATLVGLNKLWKLNLSNKELEVLSAEIGSDMPFCLEGGTQLCFGRGEKLEKVSSNFSSMAVLLVKDPTISVSTPWAYKRYREINESNYLNEEFQFEERRQALRKKNPMSINSFDKSFLLRNDLQQVVEDEISAVRKSLEVLRKLPGSLAVAMSGSGPSCFALYGDVKEAKAIMAHHKSSIQGAGLEAWCCSFRSNGACLD